MRLSNTHPLTWGMDEYADVMFSNAPTYRFPAEAEAKQHNLTRLAWFDTKTPLRSGWAWGQERLQGGLAAAQASVGRGTIYLFGPEILFRAQPHGTFKFLFNGIHLAKSGAQAAQRQASQ